MIAEQRIRDAVEEGHFKNLPGKGKPLNLTEDEHVPDEMRMAVKILKNANMLPPELELQRDVRNLQALIAQCVNDDEVRSLRKQLTIKQLKLDLTLERSGRSLPVAYADRVYAHISERGVTDA